MVLNAKRVRELLDYDPTTGILTWRPHGAMYSRIAGRKAGYWSKGTYLVEVDYKSHAIQTVAWVHYHGIIPNGRIVHKDGDRSNNRIANLEEVPRELLYSVDAPLTAERLRALVTYDPETGAMEWKARRGAAKKSCARGVNDSGYSVLRVDKKAYRVHRLAWLYVYGNWPSGYLDHINGVRTDNRISNLREATVLDNNRNSNLMRTNTSGYRGVIKEKRQGVWTGRWVAQISINNTCTHIGAFSSKEAAFDAYMVRAREVFGDFCPSLERARVKRQES